MKPAKTILAQIHRLLTFFSLFLAILLGGPIGCATAHLAGAKNPHLAREMIGTWVHVGSPGHVIEPPTKGGRFKSRTGTHWVLTTADPYTGLVTEVFGGSYTLKGNKYVETQRFADERWLQDNGKSFEFLVTVQGDTMTQTGVGNPYNEVWKRVK